MPMNKADEANRLYWHTEKSVADIADALDLSRRALYDAIEPITAAVTCTVCGGVQHYSNRSARDAAQPTCFVCATSSPQQAPAVESEAWTWSPGIPSGEVRARVAASDHSARVRRLGAAALIGAVVGAGVTHLLLRRD
jgi:hypothetical protein